MTNSCFRARYCKFKGSRIWILNAIFMGNYFCFIDFLYFNYCTLLFIYLLIGLIKIYLNKNILFFIMGIYIINYRNFVNYMNIFFFKLFIYTSNKYFIIFQQINFFKLNFLKFYLLKIIINFIINKSVFSFLCNFSIIYCFMGIFINLFRVWINVASY